MADMIFGIHCHQPVGNFESVIVKAFNRAYKPFIKAVYRSSNFKFALHFSGVLLEWIKERERELFDLIGRLIADGRCEPIVSGFYEPILAVIPREDRIEQVMMAKEWIIREWGVEPKGLWLTERVWDSSILVDLVSCGIEFVVVDDYHLISSGIPEDKVKGYFITEKDGFRLKVFPINEKLRYLIPFRPVSEVSNFLSTKTGTLLIFDDGEKFGIWPSTYKWVYEDGWLETFVSYIEEGKIRMKLFIETLKEEEASGLCYIPVTSYFEMGEWALPAREGYRFSRLVKELKEQNLFDQYRPFIKGGIWHNFLVKYDEANRMHKKMILISKELRSKGSGIEEAKIYLFKGQCNDAYWHGIFGGLYLPHLRRAVYENLIKAENYLDDTFIYDDIDFDGKKEIYIRKDEFVLWIYPHLGGMAKEISLRSCSLNIADCLRRREEAYHLLARRAESKSSGVVKSIHDMERSLDVEPEYDDYDRGCFIDRYFLGGKEFSLANEVYEVIDFKNNSVSLGFRDENIKVLKTFSVKNNRLDVSYEISSAIAIRPEFEVNLNLGTDQSTIIINGIPFSIAKNFHYRGLREIRLISPFIPGEIFIELSFDSELFVVPIYTVSQSEAGFERVYQNSAIIFKSLLEGEDMRLRIGLEVRYA